MFSETLTCRYPDIFRDPVDLDFAGATADIDHMFGHEFSSPFHNAQFMLKDSATQIPAKPLTQAPPTARTPRTFGNYEIFRWGKWLAPSSWPGKAGRRASLLVSEICRHR
jgi:hypothetical protein